MSVFALAVDALFAEPLTPAWRRRMAFALLFPEKKDAG